MKHHYMKLAETFHAIGNEEVSAILASNPDTTPEELIQNIRCYLDPGLSGKRANSPVYRRYVRNRIAEITGLKMADSVEDILEDREYRIQEREKDAITAQHATVPDPDGFFSKRL